MMKPRECKVCGSSRGTLKYSYTGLLGSNQKGYFHPDCYRTFLTKLGILRDGDDTLQDD
jgi:hypothetical protein